MRKILSLLICSIALSLSAATIIEVDGLYYNLLSDSASVEVTYPTSGHYQMTTLSIPSSVSYNDKAYTVTAKWGKSAPKNTLNYFFDFPNKYLINININKTYYYEY